MNFQKHQLREAGSINIDTIYVEVMGYTFILNLGKKKAESGVYRLK